jgi:hypothetical protein
MSEKCPGVRRTEESNVVPSLSSDHGVDRTDAMGLVAGPFPAVLRETRSMRDDCAIFLAVLTVLCSIGGGAWVISTMAPERRMEGLFCFVVGALVVALITGRRRH